MINLHIMHSWGGGLERWVQDYCRADTKDTNFVLKSIGEFGVPAKQICLYRHIDDPAPIRLWHLDKPIVATAVTHLEYRYILQEIIDMFHVDNLLISSFIGHALELLQTKVRTVIICHDFYPFCPVIVAYFKENCQECNFSHLKKCFSENPTKFFPFTSAIEWMEVRDVFINTLRRKQIPLIIPSPFMKDRLISLEPKLAEVPMFAISHGILPFKTIERSSTNRLNSIKKKPRILILGELSTHKGFDLFSQICDRLCEIADIYLVGCGDSGFIFKRNPQVQIIARYQREELGTIVNDLEIDLGLLLSTWTETFSYTLSELMSMGIPTLTTNIGSFADRIEEGVNGFLVNPSPEDVVNKVNLLLNNNDVLEIVRKHLVGYEHKSVDLMVLEYQEQLNSDSIETNKIDIFSQVDRSSDLLNFEKLQLQIEFQRNEIADLRLSQNKLQTQLEYKEFYPNWENLKKRREPMSQRFKVFNQIKRKFPGLWHYLRNLSIYLKVLH